MSPPESPVAEPAELSWRIPLASDPQLYRIGTLQILAATLFFGVFVVSVAPNLLLPALAAVIPIMALLLWRNRRRKGPGRKLPDNVRIDSRGVAWLDEAGHEHLFACEQVEGFSLGSDKDTLRDVPALSLWLAGGFASQPIEVHSPVNEDQLREVLANNLMLREVPAEKIEQLATAAIVSGVDLTVDDPNGLWELRGTRADLLAACDRLAAEAERLRLFPVGARPLTLQFGGESLRLAPGDDEEPNVFDSTFHGSSDQLIALAAKLGSQLESADVGQMVEVPIFDHPDSWLVRLRVQNAL